MFVDSVNFSIKSGKGGAGCVSFRREKFVILGGPDGGDGGDGGDVYFLVDNNTHTLSFYKGKTLLKAKDGEPGSGRKKSGKKGEDLTLIVPPGTVVIDNDTNEVLLDCKNLEKVLFLKGGKGGLGNVHFKNSTNQTPEYAQNGEIGKEVNVRLELKSIADVGLVGFPNTGKSTLISIISNAKPQIANYEFTTLTPKLGSVSVGDFDGFVMADIPGIIEGAHHGKGLGLKFLKHIERTKILLFMLDICNYRSLKEQFLSLEHELKEFTPSMCEKKLAIAITKVDALINFEEVIEDFKSDCDLKLSKLFNSAKFILPISSATNFNIDNLKYNLLSILKQT